MEIDATLPKDKRILLAAEQVFTMYGYERATLDEIIALADVGKGTVYKYFGNKEGLFYKLVSERNEKFIARLQAAVDNVDTFPEKLISFFEVMVDFYRNNSNLWQIIYFEMTGETNGCTVKEVNGVYQVVPRYSQIVVPEELRERIMRYFQLIYSGYSIVEKIVYDEYQKGTIKETIDVKMPTTHLFFGVAMGIFHYSDDVNAKMTNRECAETIVDRFMYGQIANK